MVSYGLYFGGKMATIASIRTSDLYCIPVKPELGDLKASKCTNLFLTPHPPPPPSKHGLQYKCDAYAMCRTHGWGRGGGQQPLIAIYL